MKIARGVAAGLLLLLSASISAQTTPPGDEVVGLLEEVMDTPASEMESGLASLTITPALASGGEMVTFQASGGDPDKPVMLAHVLQGLPFILTVVMIDTADETGEWVWNPVVPEAPGLSITFRTYTKSGGTLAFSNDATLTITP